MSTINRTADEREPVVWDLADMRAQPSPRSAPMTAPEPVADRRGPLAALAGAAAAAAALTGLVPAGARWGVVLGLGALVVVLVAAVLRRRQSVPTVVLAVVGGAGAALAPMVLLLAPGVPLVASTVLPGTAASTADASVATTAALQQQPDTVRDAATTAAASLAQRLRGMHGTAGPFPDALSAGSGTVVERGGMIGDVLVGTVPEGMHVVYGVSPDRRYFRVRVALDADAGSSADADSTLDPLIAPL